MEDKDFLDRIAELKSKFERRLGEIRAEYDKEIEMITKSIEERRLSKLRKELKS